MSGKNIKILEGSFVSSGLFNFNEQESFSFWLKQLCFYLIKFYLMTIVSVLSFFQIWTQMSITTINLLERHISDISKIYEKYQA